MALRLYGDGNIENVTSINNDVSSTELGYLDGVSSTLQGQIDNIGGWQSYTPTWVNLTVGNATQVFRYSQIGKTVHLYGYIELGSASSVGNGPGFSLPVSAASSYSRRLVPGMSGLLDSGTELYYGNITIENNNVYTRRYRADLVNLITGPVDGTSPFTWTTGDQITFIFFYEAA